MTTAQNRVPRGTPTGGQFAPSTHAESDVALDRSPTPVPVPPDIGPGLVRPVTCRKCGGGGDFTYVSGAVGACAPCAGTGQVEGDQAAVRARRARSEAVAALVTDAYAHSFRAAWSIQHLREHEPERFERALVSHLNGRADLMEALDDYYRERDPHEQALAALRDWTPPQDGLDTPDGAFDTCKQVSAAYTAHLRARGVDADWVQVVGMKHQRPHALPQWLDVGREHWQHYLTRVRCADGQTRYVDWTSRQFEPGAPYPCIESPVLTESRWDQMYEIEPAALDDYVASWCPPAPGAAEANQAMVEVHGWDGE